MGLGRRLGLRSLGFMVRAARPPRHPRSGPNHRPAQSGVAEGLAARFTPDRRPRLCRVGVRGIPQPVAGSGRARIFSALGRVARRTAGRHAAGALGLDRMAPGSRTASPRLELSQDPRSPRTHCSRPPRRGHRAHRMAGALESVVGGHLLSRLAVDPASAGQAVAGLARLLGQPLAGRRGLGSAHSSLTAGGSAEAGSSERSRAPRANRRIPAQPTARGRACAVVDFARAGPPERTTHGRRHLAPKPAGNGRHGALFPRR